MSENINMVDALYKTIYNQDQKIAELEAKLAEKDRQLKVMRELKNRHFNYYKTCETECSQLKQQLAEKEKLLEINERILRGTKLVRQELEQEKISFAVEKLEEVKEFLAKRKEDYLYLKDEIKAISHNQYVDFVNEVEVFELKVDNQIKAIKGEK